MAAPGAETGPIEHGIIAADVVIRKLPGQDSNLEKQDQNLL